MNAKLDLDVADQAPAQIACDDERLVTTIVNARTADEYLTAIEDAQPAEEADMAPVVASEADLPALPQLIIRAGESGGVLTQTEFRITKFCAEQKLKKKQQTVCFPCSGEMILFQKKFALKQFGSWKRL